MRTLAAAATRAGPSTQVLLLPVFLLPRPGTAKFVVVSSGRARDPLQPPRSSNKAPCTATAAPEDSNPPFVAKSREGMAAAPVTALAPEWTSPAQCSRSHATRSTALAAPATAPPNPSPRFCATPIAAIAASSACATGSILNTRGMGRARGHKADRASPRAVCRWNSVSDRLEAVAPSLKENS